MWTLAFPLSCVSLQVEVLKYKGEIPLIAYFTLYEHVRQCDARGKNFLCEGQPFFRAEFELRVTDSDIVFHKGPAIKTTYAVEEIAFFLLEAVASQIRKEPPVYEVQLPSTTEATFDDILRILRDMEDTEVARAEAERLGRVFMAKL